MTEAQLHKSVTEFLRLALPANVAMHHSPNEGKRGWQAQQALKDTGVRAGWPDIEIIHKGRAIFIELKPPKGKLTAKQIDCQYDLKMAGACVVTLNSLEAVADFLEMAVGPLRAKVRA
jgi:hypothetical protein